MQNFYNKCSKITNFQFVYRNIIGTIRTDIKSNVLNVPQRGKRQKGGGWAYTPVTRG